MGQNVYNLAALDELAGGDQDFINSMVETFLEHTPQQLEEMKQARKSGDLATLGAIAHKIKPNIQLFGIDKINDAIRELEQMGKNGEDSPAMDERLEAVDKELQIAFEQLRAR